MSILFLTLCLSSYAFPRIKDVSPFPLFLYQLIRTAFQIHQMDAHALKDQVYWMCPDVSRLVTTVLLTSTLGGSQEAFVSWVEHRWMEEVRMHLPRSIHTCRRKGIVVRNQSMVGREKRTELEASTYLCFHPQHSNPSQPVANFLFIT